MAAEKPGDQIADPVRQFIVDKINSVDLLETLLLIHSEPDRNWTAADVGRELRTSTAGADHGLVQLVTRGLAVARGSAFQYSPPASESGDIVADLAHTYQQRRVAVITLIYSKKVNSIQAFADAFRVKQIPPEEGKS